MNRFGATLTVALLPLWQIEVSSQEGRSTVGGRANADRSAGVGDQEIRGEQARELQAVLSDYPRLQLGRHGSVL